MDGKNCNVYLASTLRINSGQVTGSPLLLFQWFNSMFLKMIFGICLNFRFPEFKEGILTRWTLKKEVKEM
jgi:hypothetical protein